jgi:hypothetical protein
MWSLGGELMTERWATDGILFVQSSLVILPSEFAGGPTVVHRRQTVSERVLVVWWGALPRMPAMTPQHSGEKAIFPED